MFLCHQTEKLGFQFEQDAKEQPSMMDANGENMGKKLPKEILAHAPTIVAQ
ncbi:hypothetical protein Patl1_36895 [Pistacia atlantica]|nr:hypothetical protein Patl1_36895 [Pistacia atlantica]